MVPAAPMEAVQPAACSIGDSAGCDRAPESAPVRQLACSVSNTGRGAGQQVDGHDQVAGLAACVAVGMGGVAVEGGGLSGLDGVLGTVDDQNHLPRGDAVGFDDSGLMGVAGVFLARLQAPAPDLDRGGARAWHTAYRSFGTNPRRIRPSVDVLGRRMDKKGTLLRINPAVDSYNVVSVRHGLPAGAFDLDHVTGDVHIR